jgi:hypothetical protein
LQIEATQLESIEAIERLSLLALSAAVRTLQLIEGRNNPDLAASIAFSEVQQNCLDQLASTLAGHTQKQGNLYPHASLAGLRRLGTGGDSGIAIALKFGGVFAGESN